MTRHNMFYKNDPISIVNKLPRSLTNLAENITVIFTHNYSTLKNSKL